MAQWLVKSEPNAYSWDALVKEKRTAWTGVRNAQAANNLKVMKPGDHVLFYHSGVGLEIVGLAEVAKAYYPDPSDKSGRYGAVDIKPVMPLKTPVTLARIKAEPKLANLGLVRQSRLSVMPVAPAEWKLLCKMGGIPG
jgi:predicted RNA-binding protein with PUA-like domain